MSLSILQIYFRVFYTLKRNFLILLRIKPIKLKNYDLTVSEVSYKPILEKHYDGDIDELLNLNFTFLNKSISFRNQIEWNQNNLNRGTRLLKLNLHYQEYLVDLSMRFIKTKNQNELNFILTLIQSWISKNNYFDVESFKCSWNSYCVSVRLTNYIKVFCILKNHLNLTQKKLIYSVIKQHSKYLINNFEYDIRGNHLLENHISTLFSLVFLGNQKKFNKYLVKLYKILEYQILEDGAYFELTTMYHGIVYVKLLELVNFSKSNGFLSKTDLNKLKKIISKMLNWSHLIQIGDDTPLINDSASSLTLNFKKMDKLFKNALNEDPIINNSNKLNESGFRKFKCFKYDVLIDIGQIGASEVPGHAHADTFNTIVCDSIGPLFIDPGVSTYDNNVTRQNERSTSFHNTVSIEYENSSEVWSSFRVGKQCKVDIIYESENQIHAVHDGFSSMGVKVIRKWLIKKNTLEIEDLVKNSSLKAYQHWILAPDRSFNIFKNTITINNVKLTFESENSKIISQNIFVPVDFNVQKKTTRFSISFMNSLKTTIEFI